MTRLEERAIALVVTPSIRLGVHLAMIRSMTGFGQGAIDSDGLRFSVEIRSVNNRHVDVRFRMPGALAAWEGDLRRRVQRCVRRGRVEIQVDYEREADGEPQPAVHRPLLDAVLSLLEELRARDGFSGKLDPAAILSVSNLFRSETVEVEWNDGHRETLLAALDAALARHEEDRLREGRTLVEELLARFAAMRGHAGAIRAGAADAPSRLRDKLLERLSTLAGSVELDPGRVAQEAAFLADRCDVTEELVRLEGHLEQAARMLDRPDGEPVGKRLDFLLQEIHRETNTICSKVAELELTRSALAIKAEGEKAREQVQNLE